MSEAMKKSVYLLVDYVDRALAETIILQYLSNHVSVRVFNDFDEMASAVKNEGQPDLFVIGAGGMAIARIVPHVKDDERPAALFETMCETGVVRRDEGHKVIVLSTDEQMEKAIPREFGLVSVDKMSGNLASRLLGAVANAVGISGNQIPENPRFNIERVSALMGAMSH